MNTKSTEAGSLLSVLASLGLERLSCVYVSTPISTGSRYLEWCETGAGSPPQRSPDYRRARQTIKAANLEQARGLISSVRASYRGRLVIDPTGLADIAGWDQSDYHQYWMEVISSYVGTVVFADGWQYSEGCAVEFAKGAESGLELLDDGLWTIDTADGLSMVESARSRYAQAGHRSAVLAEVATRLRGCADTRPQRIGGLAGWGPARGTA